MSPDPGARPVLLDTSAWILALGRSGPPGARERVRGYLGSGRVAITPMVYLELLGGTRSPGEFQRLKSRLEALPELPVDPEDWREAAHLAYQLRREGKTIPYPDILIAVAALRAQALLLHADRHFDLIAQSTSLAAESLLP